MGGSRGWSRGTGLRPTAAVSCAAGRETPVVAPGSGRRAQVPQPARSGRADLRPPPSPRSAQGRFPRVPRNVTECATPKRRMVFVSREILPPPPSILDLLPVAQNRTAPRGTEETCTGRGGGRQGGPGAETQVGGAASPRRVLLWALLLLEDAPRPPPATPGTDAPLWSPPSEGPTDAV